MTFEITRLLSGLGLPQPQPTDLWAFWLLAGLWMGILSIAWLLIRWLAKADEGTRGL
jgi:hypothetical protein